ncbi:MAG TPA: hypothetical protein VEH83_00240 [Gemmatimonadales bacterium]|nr:hypothetical protein [Gemmatimonadales bacterium]
MHDITGLVAVVLIFGSGLVGVVAFSPIGRAIANAIQRKSGVGVSPEVQDALDEQAEQLEALRRQVGELAERQDFAERLLAQARERGQLPSPGGK